MSIPVHSTLDRYLGALAELPESVRPTGSPEGAVVVLDGAGRWWEDTLVAMGSGAVAVVVSRPRPAPADAVRRLTGAPVVLERALLRPDLAADVRTLPIGTPSALVVECHAPEPALAGALLDALGWVAVVAPGPQTLRSADVARGRGVALLDAGGGTPVSLVVGSSAGAPADGRVRLTALGETLLELEAGGGEQWLTVTDASSRRRSPARFESPQRVALRRAIAAVDGGVIPADLADLAAETAVAEAILRSRADARVAASTS
ncbi:hypothetical protein AAIB33_14865 [Microbacterium sp. AZCO]|uniref:hypothetical protein n=1 Tax=Microbacterium sp. AZCO TaxID=3142976 RepID=UPI0031F376F4